LRRMPPIGKDRSEADPVVFLLAVVTLWRREVVRFLRQRSRLFGALGTPLVFWILIGSGLGASFQPPNTARGVSYLEYFYPGTILLVILFTAIFSSLSIIEDRKEGFLLAVLVAPVSRQAIVLGKILGATTLSVTQGVLLLLLAPLLGIPWTAGGSPALIGMLLLISLSLSSLGFAAAWKTGSMQGYHSVMNLLLFPMWLLSGAVFPADGAFEWVRWVMVCNPLSYAQAGLQHFLYSEASREVMAPMVDVGTSILVTILFGAAAFALSAFLVARGRITGL
jgi:ABC-2 type transport system permease protein